MSRALRSIVMGLVLLAGYGSINLFGLSATHAGEAGVVMAAKTPTLYDFTMNDIDGKPVNLSQYRGKVLLLVNTASFCGNTPQYSDLQAMYEHYNEKGFEILASPPTTSASRSRGPIRRSRASASPSTA